MQQPQHADRVLLVSTIFADEDIETEIGGEAYSYFFVYRAFRPLLARYCKIQEVRRPESTLAFAAKQARSTGLAPLHLAFLPLQKLYLTAEVPTVAFPFWEFPDVPSRPLGDQERDNWVAVSRLLSGLIAACKMARDAFHRAGIEQPVEILPVPIKSEYFEIEDWAPANRSYIGCKWYDFPNEQVALPADTPKFNKEERAPKFQWRELYKPSHLPRAAYHSLKALAPGPARAMAHFIDRHFPGLLSRLAEFTPPQHKAGFTERSDLDISGIVFTSIFNPFDGRKNWVDLVTAPLVALKTKSDATVVLKLVVSPERRQAALRAIFGVQQQLKSKYRCRLVVVADYLTDIQMTDLTRASAFYLNASRAEGACLPLQDFMAAGRPGVAPDHSAMADFFDDTVGFVVRWSREPAHWPQDPDRALETTWARIQWDSFHDAIAEAYSAAKSPDGKYRELADRGRERMKSYASSEILWQKVRLALDNLFANSRTA